MRSATVSSWKRSRWRRPQRGPTSAISLPGSSFVSLCRSLGDLCFAPRQFDHASADWRAVHAHKVVHRDIKPENMLLSSDGHVKIADFGVSHLFEGENDGVRDTQGSAAFMAPEMCEGQAEFSGKAADVWSAGVTLFVFVFGRLPFMAETVHLIYQSIAQDE